MDVAHIFSLGIFFFLSGAAAAQLPLSKVRNFSYLFSLAGAALFLTAGIFLLFSPAFIGPTIPITSVFSFAFSGDALSAFFVVLISLVTIAVSIYSVGFSRLVRNSGYLGFFYTILILSMYGVVLSSNIITFLVCWETMAVAAYFLVVFDRNAESA